MNGGEREVVYVVHHEYELWGREELKFIGAFATRSDAERAIEGLREQPGFRDWPEGFEITKAHLGTHWWEQGFEKVVPIHVEVRGTDPVGYECLHAVWRPGDVYRIFGYEHQAADERWAFRPGQVVRCEERTILGQAGCLVAVAEVDGGESGPGGGRRPPGPA